jgi:hypothetical protein
MPLILGANSLAGGGYEVDNSLRFNSGSSDSLTRTLGTPTNNKKWTYSFWVKQCNNAGNLLNTGSDTSYIYFRPSGASPAPYGFSIEQYVGSFQYRIIPNMVFRDHSAWRHIVIAFDTTQATASNRIKLYVNGEQVTSFNTATYPSLNLDTQTNSAVAHKIGGFASGGNLDSYLSAVNFIDGQQLTPTDFGEFDEDSGIWKPIAYEGTYGTNGFFLEFLDSSALGDDTSGNSNDFTVNNLTSIDQTTDTPTNNFTTLNPLVYSSASKTYGEGNTAITASSSGDWCVTANNIGVRSGKWYAEIKINSVGSFSAIGVGYYPYTNVTSTQLIGELTGSAGWRNNGAMPQGGTIGTYTTNDILMIAMDLDNDKLYFGKNGTWENSGVPTSGATGTGSILTLTADQDYFFVICPRGGSTYCNFGNPAFTIASGNADANGYGNFEYAVPAGYYALNTKNLAEFG